MIMKRGWKRVKARKTRPGEVVRTVLDIIEALRNDEYLYINGKVYHPSWTVNMSLARLWSFVAHGEVRRAVGVDGNVYRVAHVIAPAINDGDGDKDKGELEDES